MSIVRRFGYKLLTVLMAILLSPAAASVEPTENQKNKELVLESFERWKQGSGSPFELLLPSADWTIMGSSKFSKTYHGVKQFDEEVGKPFSAHLATPLAPTVNGLFADEGTVIVLFDVYATGIDGLPYSNSYTWYLKMKDGKVLSVIAFFDTTKFDQIFGRSAPIDVKP